MIRVAKCLLICVVAGFTLSVLAEDRVVVIWNCELNDGMTQDDVQKANGRWVKFVNENVAGGDIRSFALTPIVGDTTKFQSAFPVQTTGSSSQMSGLEPIKCWLSRATLIISTLLFDDLTWINTSYFHFHVGQSVNL